VARAYRGDTRVRAHLPAPLAGTIEGHRDGRRLAKDDRHILPGHDGDVMRRHKKVSDLVAVLE
jgi:hypothetical protein